MKYCVYILYSELHKRIYIGYTSDLISRFKAHNELSTKGYTRRFRPWIVIYCEYFADKDFAIRRETALKGGKGREWIHIKINSEYKNSGFISVSGGYESSHNHCAL